MTQMPATEVDSIASDTSLDEALQSVRDAIEKAKGCTDAERAIMLRDVEQLHEMAAKLEAGRVEIVVFGEISTGKSALINALVGDAVAKVNVRGGWTKDVWHLSWDGAGYCLPGFAQSQVVLVDTPGLNEVDGAERGEMARQAAQRADLVLFVADSDLNDTEYSALVELASSHKPIILVLNKCDLYTPRELEELLSLFRGTRLDSMVEPENIVCAKADPRQVEYIIESADGRTRSEWRKPQPDVTALKERILEVLDADGNALVALNGAMYAADKSDRMGALRVKMRNERATAIIWSYAVAKAMAVSLNPGAVLDVLGGSAVDVAMVVTLGKVYGIQITTTNAAELVTSILKAAGWVMIGEVLVSYTSSLLKGMTFGGSTIISALPQGAAAGYGSYIVGHAARYYFEHGASWGERGPKSVVTRILDNTQKKSVIEHLKAEIRKKISVNPYAKGKL